MAREPRETNTERTVRKSLEKQSELLEAMLLELRFIRKMLELELDIKLDDVDVSA